MMTPAIFFKDVRIGLKHLLIAPVSLAAMYVLLKLIWEGHYGQPFGEAEIARFSIAVLACFNCFIAIVIGAQVMAEERNAGTDVLLARLPISQGHLYAEKVAAGLTSIALLYAATLLYLSFLGADAFWNSESILGTIPRFLFITMFSSYLFALVCSRYTHQSIAILFLSVGAECLLWLGIGVVDHIDEVDWYALRMTIAFAFVSFVVPAMLVWRQWHLPLHPGLWRSPHRRARVTGMIWKSFAENGFLHVMCFMLLLATVILALVSSESIRYGDSHAGTFIPVVGVLLLAALGTNSYATSERTGLHCITYYHPIPKGLLFLTKQVAALPAVLMVSFALVLTVQASVPAISIVVFSIFLYLHAVQVCLTYQKGTVVVILAALMGAWIVCLTIVAWMAPTDNAIIFDGFTPVHDPFLVGLIPLTLVAIGSLWTTWRLATNRRFLASSDTYRQRYSLACFLGVGAATGLLVSLVQQVVVL